jgi:DNA polymerase III epsilon subunit-like protein
MGTPLAFIDTETTGLDPDLHQLWEVAAIIERNGVATEHVWQLPVDLGRADPMALKIGRFHERRRVAEALTQPRVFAETFARLTAGCHLVGAVISFDEERLRRLLRHQHECPMWHYHLIDVEALAAGWLFADATRCDEDYERRAADPESPGWEKAMGVLGAGWRRSTATPPWNSEELSKAVGVDPEQFDRHTALGDARWARALYFAVMGGGG